MKSPKYSLDLVKALAAKNHVRTTQRASTEAQNEFGFSEQDMIEVITSLKESDFHKSDISEKKNQPFDVYIKQLYSDPYKRMVDAYIKIRVTQDLLIISFHSSY